PHSAVPASLDGLTILHLTDTHIRRREHNHPSFRRVLDALQRTPVDLVALTGDYMTRPGDEPAAIDMLPALADAWTPWLGAFGAFANTAPPLVADLARKTPNITWLETRSIDLPARPLRLVGASYPEDLLGAVLDAPPPDPARLPLVLTHYPTEVFPAAE